MRRTQLKIISWSYLAANMFVFIELILLFGVKNPRMGNCVNICASPYSNWASLLMITIATCRLVPTHLFLISFYIIPRRFNAGSDKEISLLNDTQQPLLEQNLCLVEDDINWQRENRGDSMSGSGSGVNVPKDDSTSLFSGKLSGRGVRRSSKKMHRPNESLVLQHADTSYSIQGQPYPFD